MDGASVVAESALPEKAGNGDGDTPLYSPAWVARRLGVTPATLRTWHHRYDLGPTGRTTGRHRRYSPTDLERLDRMRQLTTGGIGVAEAARLSHESPITTRHGRAEHEDPSKPTTVPAAQLERLIAAADDLDQVSTGRIVHDALRVHGVVSTWDELVTPALRRAGERFACSSDGIQSEHVLSESVRAALGDVVRRDRDWEPVPPILIAAPDGEQHVLPLHAVAAGLAELHRPSVLLGASVPAAALVAAAARVEPAVIFLWSHDPVTARRVDLTGTPTTTSRTGPALILGGPGWPRRPPRWAAALVDDLVAALRVCLDPPVAS